MDQANSCRNNLGGADPRFSLRDLIPPNLDFHVYPAKMHPKIVPREKSLNLVRMFRAVKSRALTFPHCLCEYSVFPTGIRSVWLFSGRRVVDGKAGMMELKIPAKTMGSALLNPLPEGAVPCSPCLGILGSDGRCAFPRSRCLRMERTQRPQKLQNLLP